MTGLSSDEAEFAEQRRLDAAEIAADEELRKLSLDAVTRSDLHNFSYVWRWLGVPIIQMPTDIMVLQEIVWETRPQVIVETGVARGGSVILFASLLELLGEGQVFGVDVDIRPHTRAAVEKHPMAHRVRLVEGSSVSAEVLDQVRSLIGGAERVMVVLDSDHSHEHVLAELRLYGPLVTKGQFLVVSDTVVEFIPEQGHRPRAWGPGNNPHTALEVFLAETDRFERDEASNSKLVMSSQPGGYLRCTRD